MKEHFNDFKLTPEYVRHRLNYDAITGQFTWKNHTKRHSGLIGKRAGCVSYCASEKKTTCIITLNGVNYRAHRIAWIHFYGASATRLIDHIDGDPSNNAISNLRLATAAQNSKNLVRDPKPSGLPQGVRRANGRFVAGIRISGVSTYLGTFDTPEDASTAYKAACDRTRGEFSPTHRL